MELLAGPWKAHANLYFLDIGKRPTEIFRIAWLYGYER